ARKQSLKCDAALPGNAAKARLGLGVWRSVEVKGNMASCRGNPPGVAVEAGQADLDWMRGQREIDVEMGGCRGDASVAPDDPGRLVESGEGQAVPDAAHCPIEPFARRLAVRRNEAGARPFPVLSIRERREKRPDRIVFEIRALDERAARQREEVPDVE